MYSKMLTLKDAPFRIFANSPVNISPQLAPGFHLYISGVFDPTQLIYMAKLHPQHVLKFSNGLVMN